jgi:hypothetical protein
LGWAQACYRGKWNFTSTPLTTNNTQALAASLTNFNNFA